MNKRSNTIRTLVTNEAVKNYAPVAITNAIKEYAKNELGLNDSVEYLRRRKVANIRYKLQGPMNAHLIGSENLGIDISETLSYLRGEDYHTEHYHVSQQSANKVKRTEGIKNFFFFFFFSFSFF